VILAVACAAPPAATQGTPEDEKAIRGVADKFVAAFNASDAAGMAALADESYQAVSSDGTMVKGKAGVQQAEEAGIKARQAANISMTLNVTTDYLMWNSAESATVGGAWSATGLPPGGPAKGSWLAVVRKATDGQWLMTSSLAADYVPPPPLPPAAPSAPAK
jgi:ketosteroid isomerase-like protein